MGAALCALCDDATWNILYFMHVREHVQLEHLTAWETSWYGPKELAVIGRGEL